MTTTTARLEANRQNALKSTGPKSAEGKAGSRLNAFKHGMAGGGDLLGPDDDAQLVAERAAAFGRELHAVGLLGQRLAHRAALLSVRMERLATREMVAVRAAGAHARAEFDADRTAAIDELLAEAMAPGGDPTEALATLADCPDGLARLLGVWRTLVARLRSAEPGAAAEIAASWLGLPTAEGGHLPAADLIRRGEAEIQSLAATAGALAGTARAIEQARRNAGLLARFDPGPEATLARRYEAAAERGMYRAIREIAALNRLAGSPSEDSRMVAPLPVPSAAENPRVVPSPADLTALIPPRPAPPRPDQPLELASLASFGASTSAGLASFRVGIAPASPTQATPLDPSNPAARKRRPDPRKLASARR